MAKPEIFMNLRTRSRTAIRVVRETGRMWHMAMLLAALNFRLLVAWPQSSRVIIDGNLNDGFWQLVAPFKLVPMDARLPPEPDGEVRAAVAGRYLYLCALLPVSAGRCTMWSIGKNQRWERESGVQQDSFSRPADHGCAEVKDFVWFILRVYDENDWMLQVEPRGTYAVKWRWTGEREWFTSRPDKCDRFLVATAIREKEWSVEAAIPLEQLGSPEPGYIRLSVERNRAEGRDTPEEWWRWPEHKPTYEVPVIPMNQLDPKGSPWPGSRPMLVPIAPR